MRGRLKLVAVLLAHSRPFLLAEEARSNRQSGHHQFHGTRDERSPAPGNQTRGPFNLHELVALRHPAVEDKCGPSKSGKSYGPGEVANLAIARTGSESLTKALKKNEQRSHHNHDCRLADVVFYGARRVVISLRHPVARIVSGFQRRLDSSLSSNIKKYPNKALGENFRSTGLDDYVAALKDPRHPKHEIALDVTYGENRQSFMLPMVGYYLGVGFSGAGSEQAQVEVRFLCTPTLSRDFVRAGEAWGLTFSSMSANTAQHHASTVHSDESSSTRTTALHESYDSSSAVAKKVALSNASRAFIEGVYARDVDLYERHCGGGDSSSGGGNAPGGSGGLDVARYACSAKGAETPLSSLSCKLIKNGAPGSRHGGSTLDVLPMSFVKSSQELLSGIHGESAKQGP